MADGAIEIHLEALSPAGDSVTGYVWNDRGVPRRFEGRLGLLAAIDVLIAAAAVPDAPGEASATEGGAP